MRLGQGRTGVAGVMSWRRKRSSAVVGAVAVAMGVSGLAGAGVTGASAKTVAKGGTLTIVDPGAPPTLDPGSGSVNYNAYVDLAYDPLIVMQPNGSFTPGLATAWSYGHRNTTFSITLRPHVEFSDGSPLTASAVKKWIEHEVTFPGGIGASVFANLKSIRIQGRLKLTLHFGAPTPDLELAFSELLQMGMIGSPKAIPGKQLTAASDGAGEYMLDKSQTVIGSRYTFVPNPHYWNPSAVHWHRVVIKVVTNPTSAIQALSTGQAQVSDVDPASNIDAIKSAGLRYVAPPTLIDGLILSDRSGKLVPALAKAQVRQALNYALNRPPLAALAGAGHGMAIDQFAVPGDDSYDPALKNAYPYNVAKAKQLLAAAGYPQGFTMTIDTTSLDGEDTLAQAVAGQLAAIGVTVKLDDPSLESDYFSHLAVDPAATVGFGRLPTSLNYTFLYGPDATIWNPFKSTSPQLTNLYNELAAAPSTKTDVYARKIQDFLSKNAWFVPIAAVPLVDAYTNSVTGVNATAQRGVDYDVEIEPKS